MQKLLYAINTQIFVQISPTQIQSFLSESQRFADNG